MERRDYQHTIASSRLLRRSDASDYGANTTLTIEVPKYESIVSVYAVAAVRGSICSRFRS